MAIYPDKRDGRLTGRFRVDLERKGFTRYRKRHDTLLDAQEDEKRVLILWDQGISDTTPSPPRAGPTSITLAEGIKEAKGILWRGSDNADLNFAHVRFFASTVGDDIRMGDIDTQKVRQMIRALDKAGKSDATVNRYLSHLRTFLRWQTKEKNCPPLVDDITWDWRKETKGRLRWLTFAEEDQLVSLVPEKTGKLIRVATVTGCRREELLSLTDARVKDDHIYIPADVSKNRQERFVPITLETAQLLRELLAAGMPSARQLRRHWDAAKVKMGLAHDAEFVFHACRHTCATRMVDADVDTLLIKEWLGHKRIETTQRYAHVKGRKLHSILDRVGGLRAMEEAEARKTAALSTPPSLPPGGGIEPLQAAA